MSTLASIHVLMILESHYPARGGGGAEGQVRTLAGGLRARGHRVTIVTPLSPKGPQARVSRVDGVPVCRLAFPRLRFIGGPFLWLAFALFLWRRRKRYDAWHAHIAHQLAAISSVMGAWLGKPVVVKVAGGWEASHALADRRSPLSWLVFRGLLRASRWHAISQRIAASLEAKGVPRERLLVLPNAVDTERLRHVRPEPDPAVRFLFVGRLAAVKALDLLLDAFARATTGTVPAHLRIVGTGSLQDLLQQRARDLGIADRVDFAGHRSDIPELLAHADFAVLPSYREGLSNTLLECMASGLPMIASRVSGSEDVVRDGDNGWLFEPGDLEGLTARLTEALSLPAERRLAMGRRARQTIEDYASLQKVLDRLLCAYQPGRDARTPGTVAHASPRPD